MAKARTKDNTVQLEELRAKVLRRGEKLAKSLRQLVAQIEPDRSPAQKLLKALEQALPDLHRFGEAKRSDVSSKPAPKRPSKAAPKRTKPVEEVKVVRPSRTKRVAKKVTEPSAVPASETASA